jgi:hypothetical protein
MMDNTMARSAVTSGYLRGLCETAARQSAVRMVCLAVFGFIGICGGGSRLSWGGTLNLAAHPPDLSAGFLTTSYDATTGILTADGWPISFNLSSSLTPDYPTILGGQYKLSAHIGPDGSMIGGSLDVTGTIPNLANSGTLLTGQLAQFGFQSEGGDIFEFIFNVTGGDLAPYYNGSTNVILGATCSGFNGSFANNFAAMPYLSIADNTIVPEPSTTILLLSALALGLTALTSLRLRNLIAMN